MEQMEPAEGLNLLEFKEYAERVFANIPSGLAILSGNLRVLAVNRAFSDLFGMPADQAEGSRALQVIEAEGLGEAFATVLGGTAPRVNGTALTRVCGGEARMIRYAVTGMRLDEKVRLLLAIEDITEQEQAFQALARSEARLAEAQRIACLGHWEWSVDTGELWWSDEVYFIFGVKKDEQNSSYALFKACIHPRDLPLVEAAIQESLDHGSDYGMDHRIILPDGSIRYVYEQAKCSRGPDGAVVRMMGTVQDITERKNTEARLSHLAHHDPLTGLPNRTLLHDRVGQAIAHARRHNRLLAVLFLDLDRFKRINDSLGHVLGDQLLQAVANRLSASVRDGDTVARLGGDEFAIALTDIGDAEDVAKIAGKILEALNAPIRIGATQLYPTTSIGVSLYPDDGGDVEALLKNADTAMYAAKEAGRNAYRFFHPEMDYNLPTHMELEHALRGALERDEFELHYQPQISLSDGRVEGVEALLRWNAPDGRSVMPDQFIPILEQTGLIIEVGAWVLNQACLDVARWQSVLGFPFLVAVNLSRRQFDDENLVESVRHALQDSGLPPELLELEVTESVVMPNPTRSAGVMDSLRRMGVRLAMDDFGTGYSSLVHLKRLPLDRLKIDEEFVHNISVNGDDVAIVRTIIALADNLGLEVVAEGVETEAQRDFLHQHGCQLAQGFLYSKALPAQDIAGFLAGQRHPPDIGKHDMRTSGEPGGKASPGNREELRAQSSPGHSSLV